MPATPLEKLLLGGCFVIAGLFLIVFHKQIKERIEDWNERVPWFLQSSPRGGRIVTVTIIGLGALLIYGGVAQLLTLFVHQ